MAPPLRNTNAVKHGLRMALARLPKGCSHVRKQADALRLVLEGALQARARAVGPYEAACIAACCKWARHGALTSRWLRLRESELSDADRLAYSREVARAADAVVHHMAKLGLDRDGTDSILDAIYGPTPAERLTDAAVRNGNGDAAEKPQDAAGSTPTGEGEQNTGQGESPRDAFVGNEAGDHE